MLTMPQIAALFPRAEQSHVDQFFVKHTALFARFGLFENMWRLTFFLAQIGHESCGLSVLTENLNYSAKRLVAVWPRRFPTAAAASLYARNPRALGSFVYANRNGNREEASSDGYRFRGRGYMQLTGRAGYQEVGALIGVNLVDQPDHVSHPEHALHVALGYWQWRDVNTLCDGGDFKAVTKKVNGGTNGWDDRLAWLAKVKRCLAA